MTILIIVVAGLAVLILAFVFYLLVERQVQVIERTVQSRPAGAEAGTDDFLPESTFGGAKGVSPDEYTIARSVQVAYARQIYVEKPFSLVVHLLPPGAAPVVADVESDVTAPDPLEFVADGARPLVEVSLLYGEDEFRVARDSIRRRLSEGAETFEFLVFAKEARLALLTVTVNHLTTQHLPERVQQKSVTTKRRGAEIVETAETVTFAPAAEVVEKNNVYSLDLPLTATTVWGLSEAQARFWQKALAPVLVVLLLLLGLLSGRLDLEQSVVMLVVGIADMAGVAVFPELKDVLLGG